MAPALPRRSRNGSRLVRLLADMAVADLPEPTQTLAERLGLWLDWTDAIALSATVQADTAPQCLPAELSVPSDAVAEQLARVRRDLGRTVGSDAHRPASRGSAVAPRAPVAGTAPDDDVNDFSAHRRRYQAHQRAMETQIKPLRANARAALASRSPDGARLAALDAVLEQALSAREQHLLSTVPGWLERHFNRLRDAHRATPDPVDAARAASGAAPPAAWLARFRRDMQEVLLAELDLRLQPVEGLLEALGHEVTEAP